MERMTFLNGDDAWCVDNENCFEEQSERYCGPAIDRLAYYEDMEEQGRLVVLPCQWGTKLYSIYAELYHLNEDGEPPIKEVWLVENNVCAIIRQFGKTVFLTREEAEQALRCEHEEST